MNKTINFKYINTETEKGLQEAVEFEANNPGWKRITDSLALTWVYEQTINE